MIIKIILGIIVFGIVSIILVFMFMAFMSNLSKKDIKHEQFIRRLIMEGKIKYGKRKIQNS